MQTFFTYQDQPILLHNVFNMHSLIGIARTTTLNKTHLSITTVGINYDQPHCIFKEPENLRSTFNQTPVS